MTRQINTLILRRLERYAAASDVQQLNAIKEMIQELALFGLNRHGLFKQAAFHGGTCLRLFYGLDRFSEDLDFALIKPNRNLQLTQFIEPLAEELIAWGVNVEVVDRSKVRTNVKKAFIKASSLGAILNLKNPLNTGQKLMVKLEVDTFPPDGAALENKLCEFPVDFYVVCHNIDSLFAGKLHAILCREYIKGRDWYDFAKYLSWKTPINFPLLRNALKQSGPLKDLSIKIIDQKWLEHVLIEKINSLNITKVVNDTLPFVSDPSVLDLWNREYFLQKVENYFEKY